MIFKNNKTNKPLVPSSIWRRIKTAAKQANIDESIAFPHNFRHLFAKTYLENSPNIFDLADILGHQSVNTTRIYNRKTTNEIRHKINQLDL